MFSLAILLPQSFYSGWSKGLDPGWQLALHLAWENGRIFGRDIIFTYGPLGFLACRYAFSGIHGYLAAWDAFFFGNVALILWMVFRGLRSYSQILIAFFTCFSFGGILNYQDASILLFFMQIYFILRHERDPKSFFLIDAAVASFLSFYIKVNSGLMAIGVMLAYGAYMAVIGRRYRFAAVYTMAYCSAFFLTTLVLPVDLVAYIVTSGHVAAGYNEAMYLEPGAMGFESHFYAALTIIAALAGFILLSWRQLLRSWQGLWLCGLTSLFTLLLFKQSFLRADSHCNIFFQYICLAMALILLFSGKKTARRFKNIYMLGLAFALWPRMVAYTPHYFRSHLTGTVEYFEELQSGPKSWKTDVPPDTAFPQEILERIGKRSVDIVPWDISLIFFNRLTYNPRPVMQSYTAYDTLLDGLNYSKYSSDSRPDFIIYSNGCVDDRHCFSDEAQTKLAMLQNYRPVDEFGDKILLERLEHPIEVKKIGKQSFEGRLNKLIYLRKPAEIEYLSVWPEYSLLGRLRSIFYQPPRLDITFFFADHTQYNFRAIKPILEGGIFANRYVGSIGDAKTFFSGDISKLAKIRAIRLTPSYSWLFKPEFKYERTQYEIQREQAD